MKRLIIALLSLVLVCGVASAQSQKAAIERIKSKSTEYKWGEGHGASMDAARKMATSDLLSKMASTKSVNSHQWEGQKGDDYILEQEESVDFATTVSLDNCENISYKEGDEWRCLCYVSIKDIERAAQRQQDRVQEMIKLGEEQEGQLNIAGALKYYYWALAMLTHYGSSIDSNMLIMGKRKNAKLWLNEHIAAVLDNIDIKIDSDRIEYDQSDYDHYTVNIDVTYCGLPVSALDLLYFNGERQVGPLHAKSGKAALKYPDINGFKELDINVIYNYSEEAAAYDRELSSAFDTDLVSYDTKCARSIPIKVKSDKLKIETTSKKSATRQAAAAPTTGAADATEPIINKTKPTIDREYISDNQQYVEAMKQVESALRSKKYASVKHLFTTDGYDLFERMVTMGTISVNRAPQYTVEGSRLFVIGKGIPVSVKVGRHTSTETIVFRFDKSTAKIKSVAYALTQRAESDIFRKSEWNIESRYSLLCFMEDYQTAFALKRLDYIKSIFSDKAIIIIGKDNGAGKKTRSKKFYESNDLGAINTNNERYTYQFYSKDDYMQKLERDFNPNSSTYKGYIQLTFEDTQIASVPTNGYVDNEVMWIELKQNYYSTSGYTDKGYLSLQINLKPDEGSKINVRTWTPTFIDFDTLNRSFTIGQDTDN